MSDLEEINRHIEALERIGGLCVVMSIKSAREARLLIIERDRLVTTNSLHQESTVDKAAQGPGVVQP